MRSLLIAALLAVTAVPSWAQDTTIIIRSGRRTAQRELPVRELPKDVADEVLRFYNAEHTVRFSGQTHIPAARGVDGDVAVLGGPVTIAGHISGSLMVVNGDLTFEPGAVVSGDVTVVGGSIVAADRAAIAGEIRSYRDPLRYRRVGEDIVYSPRRQFRPSWLNRSGDLSGNKTGFTVSLGGIYNRVEGLPLVFGPDADLRLAGDARLQVDARGIFRTAGDWSLQRGDFGFRTRAELVLGGKQSNLGLGVRGYDLVNSVEPWPLKDFEVGWSAFLYHRDYRDYFSRRGASLFATLRVSPRFSATAEDRSERQGSVEARDPFALFRGLMEADVGNQRIDALHLSVVRDVRHVGNRQVARARARVSMQLEFHAPAGQGLFQMRPHLSVSDLAEHIAHMPAIEIFRGDAVGIEIGAVVEAEALPGIDVGDQHRHVVHGLFQRLG